MSEFDDILGEATDDSVEIDFSGATELKPHEPGWYAVTLEELETKDETGKQLTARKSGDPKIVFHFKPDAGGPAIRRHVPIVGKGAGIARQTLTALGVAVEGDKLKVSRSALIGKRCEAQLAIQLDQDTQEPTNFNEIKKVRPLKTDTPASI